MKKMKYLYLELLIGWLFKWNNIEWFVYFKGFIGSPGEAGQLGPEGERVSPFYLNVISKVIYLW